jgi:voltage-gated sodium channel
MDEAEELEDHPGHVVELHKPSISIAERVIDSTGVQIIVAVIIAANAVVIGLETDDPHNPVYEPLQNAFLCIFTVELLSKMVIKRLRFLTDMKDIGWNLFDLMVVSFGLFDAYMTYVLQKEKGLGFFATLMRIFRLLRILRIFRLFRMIKQLYMLASGFVEALQAAFWVSVLCGVGLYTCAIVFTRFIGRKELESDDPDREIVAKFGNVPTSMFTLFQIMAHPNLALYAPVWDRHGEIFKIVFIAFVIVGSWAMLSLLTGVISENMLQKSQARKEEMNLELERKRRQFLERVGALFKKIDVNGDGDMSREEFDQALPAIMKLMEEEEVNVSMTDLVGVFETIDFDGSGSIDMDEFLNGMVYLSADLRAIHVVQVQYMVMKDHVKILHRLQGISEKYNEQIRSLKRLVDEL